MESIFADFISDNQIVVFGQNDCKFCDYAKNLLRSYNKTFLFVNLHELEYGYDLKSYLKETFHRKTVPIIFINGILVGGFHELQNYNFLKDSNNDDF